ncbi:hypothetical protein AX17_003912 [Amanita inopinata Kibby_2008]|nr:hypothetical protein AX17_003912 [Amanita inopinata Kibby_2008]
MYIQLFPRQERDFKPFNAIARSWSSMKRRFVVINGSGEVGSDYISSDGQSGYGGVDEPLESTQVMVEPLTTTDPESNDGPVFTPLPTVTSTVVPLPIGTPTMAPADTTSTYSLSDTTVSTPSPDPVTSTSIAPQPSVRVNNGTTASDSDNSGRRGSSGSIPGGAVAGIVIAALIFALAAGIFIFRKRAMTRRQRFRGTWLPRPFLVEATAMTDNNADVMEGRTNGGAVAGKIWGEKMIPRVAPPPLPSPVHDPMVSGTVGGRSSITAHTAVSRTNSPVDGTSDNPQDGPTATAKFSAAKSALPANAAIVKYMFEPTLPDELKIEAGEAMRVLAEYDDGWGLCQNTKGQRGMIPLECLDRGESGVGGDSGERVRHGVSLVRGSVNTSGVGGGQLLPVSRQSRRKSSLPASSWY